MKKAYHTPQCKVYDLCTQNVLVNTSPTSGYENNQFYLRMQDDEEKVTYRVKFGDYAD